MTRDDFRALQALLQRSAGIALWDEKQFVAERRLETLAGETGCASVDDLMARVRRGDGELETRVVEALTTNETYFFRDIRPFEQFETVMLPALIRARAAQRRIRIWCCAVASGQEAYSIAMVLARHKAALAGWKVDILGTDLSRAMVARAEAGRYTHFEVQRGLPMRELVEHFTREADGWHVSAALRAAVEFRVVNLARDLPALGSFDVVFCRNLLIYFDLPMKATVLTRVARLLAPDGWLVLGAAESVVGLNAGLVPDPANRGLYVRTPAAAAATA
ncbi:CheR family methyltransferase [Alsobacter sp. R-9]